MQEHVVTQDLVERRVVTAAYLANRALLALAAHAGTPRPRSTQYAGGHFVVVFAESDVKLRCPRLLHLDCQAMASVTVDIFNEVLFAGTCDEREVVQLVFGTEAGT